MKDRSQFILTLIAIISFIFYGIVIYLHVGVKGWSWGNMAVDTALELLGPVFGVIIVAVIGSIILLITFLIQRTKQANVFLCWFWILSLYQCVVNAFLQFYGLPDEAINQFFKTVFPDFWYPAKEVCFLIISLLLTYLWVKRVSKRDFSTLDIGLIALAAFVLVGGTVLSQLFLMN